MPSVFKDCAAMPLRSRGLSNRTRELQVEIVSQLAVNSETMCFLWGTCGIHCLQMSRQLLVAYYRNAAAEKTGENRCCVTLITRGHLQNGSGALATSPFTTRPLTDVGR